MEEINPTILFLEYEEVRQQAKFSASDKIFNYIHFILVFGRSMYFEHTEGAKSYMDLLKPGKPRRIMLGTSLQMWSQLCGKMYVPW